MDSLETVVLNWLSFLPAAKLTAATLLARVRGLIARSMRPELVTRQIVVEVLQVSREQVLFGSWTQLVHVVNLERLANLLSALKIGEALSAVALVDLGQVGNAALSCEPLLLLFSRTVLVWRQVRREQLRSASILLEIQGRHIEVGAELGLEVGHFFLRHVISGHHASLLFSRRSRNLIVVYVIAVGVDVGRRKTGPLRIRRLIVRRGRVEVRVLLCHGVMHRHDRLLSLLRGPLDFIHATRLDLLPNNSLCELLIISYACLQLARRLDG